MATKEVFTLKDTDEITIYSNNKAFHIHWGTLKTLLLQQVQVENTASSLEDLLTFIQGELGYWYIGNNGETLVTIGAPTYFLNTIKAEALPSYADSTAAEADGQLPTGSFYTVTGGAMYQKLS